MDMNSDTNIDPILNSTAIFCLNMNRILYILTNNNIYLIHISIDENDLMLLTIYGSTYIYTYRYTSPYSILAHLYKSKQKKTP